MNIGFTVRRPTGELTAREYDFLVIADDLRCIRYSETERPSKRHKSARTVAMWSWYHSDYQRMETGRVMSWSEVPYDDTVAAEARAVLLSKIRVAAPEPGK